MRAFKFTTGTDDMKTTEIVIHVSIMQALNLFFTKTNMTFDDLLDELDVEEISKREWTSFSSKIEQYEDLWQIVSIHKKPCILEFNGHEILRILD